MKFMIIGLFAVSIFSYSQTAVPIERYGVNGDLTPTVMGQPMPDVFFTTHRSQSLANERNYIASFTLPNHTAGETVGKTTWELILSNESEIQADIVLSAVKRSENEVRNFIVRVPVGEVAYLDLQSLSEYHNIHLISMFSFRAWFEEYGSGKLLKNHELATRLPEIDVLEEAKNEPVSRTNYCQSIRVLRYIHGPGGTVAAHFDKLHRRDIFEVYYPAAGDLFHYETGFVPGNEPCYMVEYHTKQYDTHLPLIWYNMENNLFGWESGWACRTTGTCTAQSPHFTVMRLF